METNFALRFHSTVSYKWPRSEIVKKMVSVWKCLENDGKNPFKRNLKPTCGRMCPWESFDMQNIAV